MTSIITYVSDGPTTTPVGTAYTTVRRTRLSTSFRYDAGYLGLPGAYAIDPQLPVVGGGGARSLLGAGLPGAFSDAAPDRWGRNMISKRLRAQALADGRTPPTIGDVDYLLGVSDTTRQGALRFKLDEDGDFQHPGATVPKLISLPELRRAAEKVATDDPDEMTGIKILLDAGTGSLGGARPKASVRDGDQLFIAKFTHPDDEWSVIAWEKTALDLAEAAGISVPHTELLDIDGHDVLLLKRFDRRGHQRVGYISAMTLLQGSDGTHHDYIEIAEALAEHGSAASADLEQLWRRIAFSVAIHNTDDHLRNHGLLREGAGWRLSPAFDVNPNPSLSSARVTSIGGSSDLATDIIGLLTYSRTFGISAERAREIINEVVDAVRHYPEFARRNTVPTGEIARFAATLDATIDTLANGTP